MAMEARVIVGGREFNMTKHQVEAKMRGEAPELIQKHVVEVGGTVFPTKQVLGHVTGWGRTTFTTMEAQRVLRRIGFVCRGVGVNSEGRIAWVEAESESAPLARTDGDRIAALEAGLVTAQEAIAGLATRVRLLEASI
jgi:hypothetical protein